MVQLTNNLPLTKNTHVVHTDRRLCLAQSQARNRSHPQLSQFQRNTGMTGEELTAYVFQCLLSSVPSQHPQTDTGVCIHSHRSSSCPPSLYQGISVGTEPGLAHCTRMREWANRSLAFPGARLTGGFKLSDMDAENWIKSFGRAISTLCHKAIIPLYFILHNWTWTKFPAGRFIHSMIHCSLNPTSYYRSM